MNDNIVQQIVDGEWLVTMRWDESNSRSPSYMTVEPLDPENIPHLGLSSTVVRFIDFTAAVAEFRRRHDSESETQTSVGALKELRRAGVTDLYLAGLSDVYIGLARSTPKPVQALAGVLGVGEATVKGQLWRASRIGLLERSPGRVGGTLTDKAKELLK